MKKKETNKEIMKETEGITEKSQIDKKENENEHKKSEQKENIESWESYGKEEIQNKNIREIDYDYAKIQEEIKAFKKSKVYYNSPMQYEDILEKQKNIENYYWKGKCIKV